jgi:hypothetical protein
MKKVILAFSLLAILSTSFVSCSTDDSGLEQTANDTGTGTGTGSDNGGGALPKPRPSA